MTYKSGLSLTALQYARPVSIPRVVSGYNANFAILTTRSLNRSCLKDQTKTIVRYASSEAVRVSGPPEINPPASTLPPILVTPGRAPDQSAVSYYFGVGKAYLQFYKSGLKAVFTNFKTQNEMMQKIPQGSGSSIRELVESKRLTRGDFQLYHRAIADVKLIPIFGLIMIICGEFTPLIVIGFPKLVPRTCRFPKQIQQMRESAEGRRKTSFQDGTITASEEAFLESDVQLEPETLPQAHSLHIGRSLGLYSTIWDYLGGLPSPLLRRRIAKWKEYTDLDDRAIKLNGGIRHMDIDEVRIALEERGIDILHRNDSTLRELLQKWLDMKKKVGVVRLLLTRPNVWDRGL